MATAGQDGEQTVVPEAQPTKRQLSRRQTFAICLCQANEGVQITLPYTIAVYMVRDFIGEGNEQRVGQLTGVLAACFCFSQFVTSYPWGMFSDRWGRKRLVVMSNMSSMVSVLAFGLSGNYAMAVTARLLGGLFNCTFMNVKSMIGEATDSSSQAYALAALSTSWGIGTICGPSIGGALANPCDNFAGWFPLCRRGQLFAIRPFLLPCLATALLSFCALLSSIFVLQETLPRLTAAGQLRDAAKRQRGRSKHEQTADGEELEMAALMAPEEPEGKPQATSASTWTPEDIQQPGSLRQQLAKESAQSLHGVHPSTAAKPHMDALHGNHPAKQLAPATANHNAFLAESDERARARTEPDAVFQGGPEPAESRAAAAAAAAFAAKAQLIQSHSTHQPGTESPDSVLQQAALSAAQQQAGGLHSRSHGPVSEGGSTGWGARSSDVESERGIGSEQTQTELASQHRQGGKLDGS
ncbi:hypothetical protein WJX72_005779 [[Myrmecia] bisecta]|uniref:Major facilitator superfamily (MFS) profile domain-containing protein n=1 Tax=[Myrmecia] bisecta TaxID=41462 RepID=A0AAW1QQL5_9CHLO